MEFNKRLDEVGWALFLLMIGILWLVPDDVVPHGAWMVGTGVILLGINVVRSVKSIPINGFSTALGAFALVAGLISIIGIDAPIFPILLVVVGAMLLFKPLFVREA